MRKSGGEGRCGREECCGCGGVCWGAEGEWEGGEEGEDDARTEKSHDDGLASRMFLRGNLGFELWEWWGGEARDVCG